MKQLIIIIGVLLGMLFYGNYANSIDLSAEASVLDSEIDNQYDQTVVLMPLAMNSNLGLNEHLSTTSSHITPSTEKHRLTEYQSLIRFSEHITTKRFLQYTFYTSNLLIRYRKADIIFPFHYHW